MNERGRSNSSNFFNIDNPRALWNARSEVPGLRSVMSIGEEESLCESETQFMQTRILEELGDLSNKVVLEVGTGVGRFTGMLGENSAQVISVDISEGMLKRAKRAVSSPNISYVQAVGQNLPLRDASCDLVVETSVLIHIVDTSDFNAFLSEAKRVLKPEGTILLCGPLAEGQATQIHPYLKYRTLQDYKKALNGFLIESKGNMQVSNADYHILTARRNPQAI